MKRPPFKLKPEHTLPLILVAVVLSLTFIVSLRSKLRQPPAPAVASAPRTASDVAAKDYSWVHLYRNIVHLCLYLLVEKCIILSIICVSFMF